MTTTFRQITPRLGAWLLLLAYLCALPAALPLLISALARAEGSHGVEVCLFGSEARVTLTHDGARHSAAHRHSALACLLVAFAQPRRNAELDHIVKFVAPSNLLEERRAAAPDRDPAAGCAATSAIIGHIILPRPCDLVAWRNHFLLENAPPAFFPGLKSTLLLI